MSGWTQRMVGVIMLVALAGLPATATTCAALCESPAAPRHEASASSTLHGAGASCHESAAPAAARVLASSPHDCGSHEGAVQEAEAAQTRVRSSAQTLIAVTFSAITHSAHRTSNVLLAPSGHEPPAVSSAARTPLVLRV